MVSIEKTALIAALKNAMPGLDDRAAELRAGSILSSTDSRIAPNLLEWIQGHPITDLWVGKYCINAILSIRGDGDFLSALDAMNLYLRDPDAGELLIWRTRR